MMISLAGGPALVPALVRREQLATANALEMLSFTLGGVIGPALAGAADRLGRRAERGASIDAVSYFVLSRWRWHVRGWPASRRPRAGCDGQAITSGMRSGCCSRTPVLLATTLMFMAFNIGGGLLCGLAADPVRPGTRRRAAALRRAARARWRWARW